jgi:hypothetical protein
LARGAYLGALEKADVISPAERESRGQVPLYSGLSEEQQKGYASPFMHWPTYKGVTEGVKELAPQLGAPQLAYVPQTVPGKVAGAAAEIGMQGIPGALRTMPGRIMSGAGVGAGSELGAQLAADGEHGELFWRLVGGAGGGLASGVVSNLVKSALLPSGAQDKLVRAMAEDYRRGQMPMTPEQAAEAAQRGEPVSVYDMAGPNTKRLLAQYSDLTPTNQDRAKAFNAFLNDRRAESSARISEHIQGVTGRGLDAAAITEAEKVAGDAGRNSVYKIARAEPEAQNIPHSAIGDDLLNRPIFKAAMRDAEETSKNIPEWGIQVPLRTPGVPGVESHLVQTDRGLIKIPEVPEIPVRETPGNLSYWDQVKRELDNKRNMALRTGDQTAFTAANEAKKDLVSRLDSLVPSYKTARDTASELFGAETAPAAGYNFYGTTNQFKLKDITEAVSRYTPEQKDLFASGVTARLNQDIQAGKLGTVANRLMKDKNFSDRLRLALGDERYDSIAGKILSENLMGKAQEINFLRGHGISPATAGMFGASIPAAFDVLQNVVSGAALAPSTAAMTTGLVSGAMVTGAREAQLMAERSLANRVLPMAFSQKPEDIQTLGRLARQNSNVSRLFDKWGARLSGMLTQPGKAEPGHAAGGRVKRRAGGRVTTADMLVSMAKRAKNNVNKTTEPLLNQPDEVVVRALDVAHKNLEAAE